jgi:probable phosphoglycerate mutase
VYAAAVDPDLAEWDYGDFEGMTAAEIGAVVPGWTAFGNGFRNGETFHGVSARADRVIARMSTLSGNVALFSHGHFSCILAARWIGLPMQDARKLVLNTASVSILGSNPHHPELRVIAMWNVLPAMFG